MSEQIISGPMKILESKEPNFCETCGKELGMFEGYLGVKFWLHKDGFGPCFKTDYVNHQMAVKALQTISALGPWVDLTREELIDKFDKALDIADETLDGLEVTRIPKTQNLPK